MSKVYLGLLDSRNTKYQGLIKDDQFNGVGLLIDSLFTTVLSTWKKSTLNGPTVIIFSTLQLCFGHLEQNKPSGLLCYQPNPKQKLIIQFNKNSQQVTNIGHVLVRQSIAWIKRSTESKEFKVTETSFIRNEEQELKVLTNLFKSSVKLQHIDLKSFLDKYFVQEHSFFELPGKKEVFFGFKEANSLGFKFQQNTPTYIGFFNSFPRNIIYGRRILNNFLFPSKTQIQEGSFEQPIKTFTLTKQNGSNLQCQRFNEQYFKKSMIFRNKFTNLSHINNLYSQLKQIQSKVKLQASDRFGQTLLENNYGTSSKQDQNPPPVIKEYTLEEMKEEIYKAAAKKQSYRNSERTVLKQSLRSPGQSKYLMKKSLESELFLQKIDTRRQLQYIEESHRMNNLALDLLQQQEANMRIANKIALRQQLKTNQILNRERQRNLIELNNYNNKTQLIKQVNDQLQAQKQFEENIIKQLIRQDQKAILLDQKLRISNLQASQHRKYKRYEPKSSPIIHATESPFKKNKDEDRKNRKYQINTSNISGQRRSSRSKSPIELIRSDRLKKNTEQSHVQINPFNGIDLNKNQIDLKGHDHLAKYKERRRDPAFGQIKKKNQNRYSYLQQNQQEQDNDPNIKKIMPQVKLFGVNKNYNNMAKNQLYQQPKLSQRVEISSSNYSKSPSKPAKRSQMQNQYSYQNQVAKSPIKIKRTFHYVD